jgi:hypothetical protein
LRILITGGKSALALKVLKAFGNDTIIVADYGDVPTFSTNSYEFISLGERNEETIAHTLLSCCLDYQIDAILPLHIFEIEPMIKASILFDEFNVNILLPGITKFADFLKGYTKGKHWAVFVNGIKIYMSEQNERLDLYAKEQNLNGAYYFEDSEGGIKLSLITI